MNIEKRKEKILDIAEETEAAKLQKMKADVKTSEDKHKIVTIELAKRSGEIILMEDADKVLQNLITTVSQKIVNMPRKYAGAVVSPTNPTEGKAVLTKIADEIIADLQSVTAKGLISKEKEEQKEAKPKKKGKNEMGKKGTRTRV